MKTAVITGASSGIGAATAERFIAAGYRVFNLSRRVSKVPGVKSIQVDLSKAYHTRDFAETLAKCGEGADSLVLIHNACSHHADSAQNTSDANLADVLALNVQAPNALNRILIPQMKPGSAILYVGSTLSEKAVPGVFSYILSKHALVGMMRATVQDLADTGVHSACICPGFTDTVMLRRHIGDDPEQFRQAEARQSGNRLIQPSEIAELLFFAATWPVINGSVIHANLGQKEG